MVAAGLTFQNPVLLAAGTAGYGREVAGVVDLDALGGLVTKAVSLEPRAGASAPRVAEMPAGMLNAVGLANPGLDAVRREELPWLAEHLRRARVVVNVVGRTAAEFAAVCAALDDVARVDAFELNVSCPNVERGGLEFGADRAALAALVQGARARTQRPLFVKLSPTIPDIGAAAAVAAEAGADGLTVINTLPGLAIDVNRRRPWLGRGSGGVSGSPLLAVGVLAARRVRDAVEGIPIIGVGGIATALDALQYLLAGANLVAVGTAALRDPRAPVRIARDLARWCARQGVTDLREIVGAVRWPA